MNWPDALEDFLYGWVRHHAPHVGREALDALIDNATDICRDAKAEIDLAQSDALSKGDRDELLMMWAGLR